MYDDPTGPIYTDQASGNPYAEWEGVDWVQGTRSFQPTPQWQLRRPWRNYGPTSGEYVPPQSDLHIYFAPAVPTAAVPDIPARAAWAAAGQIDYSGVFTKASAPMVPTSGPTLASLGIGNG